MSSTPAIDLYFWPTPNGQKITILLAALNCPYRIIPIDIGAGDQFKADFLAISPNNRIPAIIDHTPLDGGAPISVFESGAIMLYLADKMQRFIPVHGHARARADVLQWLFWQMGGLGPMSGQAGHFVKYAPEVIPYAQKRYCDEVNRLYGVMNHRLRDRDYLANDYSIADMACWPWVNAYALYGQDLNDFPYLKAWFDRLAVTSAVRSGMAVGQDLKSDLTDEATRAILFGQRARDD